MLFSLPIVGALIGWFTNYLAVKMLFHPRKKLNLILFSIQGVFPKRQTAFAHELAELVSQRLFSEKDLQNALSGVASSSKIRLTIEQHLESTLLNNLPNILPVATLILSPRLIHKIKRHIANDLQRLADSLIRDISSNLGEAFNVYHLVEQKVSSFSLDELERVVFKIMKQEFRFIEIVGAILGFLIGCIQLLLTELPKWLG